MKILMLTDCAAPSVAVHEARTRTCVCFGVATKTNIFFVEGSIFLCIAALCMCVVMVSLTLLPRLWDLIEA